MVVEVVSGALALTEEIVGSVVSITSASLAASPVVGVKLDIALPAVSAIVPEIVASRSLDVSSEVVLETV